MRQPSRGLTTMRIETEIPCCVLRPWSLADKAALVRNANNRKVWRNLTDQFPHPYTPANADRWFEFAARPGRNLPFAIDVAGEAVGGVDAVAGEGVACATAQFGYWLGEGCWGRGLATAAARAMVAYIDQRRLFARLEAPVFAWNPASMRVLEKAGFQREGVLRHSVTKDAQLIDSVMYSYLTAN